jgi:hypothetical protein
MNNSIRTELTQHLIDHLHDQQPETLDDLHRYAFNESPYIIGYYRAEEWLKDHDVSPFEAIAAVIDWEQSIFGEVNFKPEDINAEKIVNLYVYILGEELLSEFDLDQEPDELLAELRESLDS